MRFSRENVFNVMKEMKPDAEIKLLTSMRGKSFPADKAVIHANHRFCHITLKSVDDMYRVDGYPGVRAMMRDIMHTHLGFHKGDIKIGPHDKERLKNHQLRALEKRSEILQFAMKSAGSTDEEINDWLKNV
tara:strand:+ start:103 stop:495 length:393 start_codon:yes stop_codon:yes gene_type:complete